MPKSEEELDKALGRLIATAMAEANVDGRLDEIERVRGNWDGTDDKKFAKLMDQRRTELEFIRQELTALNNTPAKEDQNG